GPTGARLTLVAGAAFCISAPNGDVLPGRPQGLFFRDTRFLSACLLRIDDQTPELLASDADGLHAATVLSRHYVQEPAGRSLIVLRRRVLTPGLRETVTLRNA